MRTELPEIAWLATIAGAFALFLAIGNLTIDTPKAGGLPEDVPMGEVIR